MDVGNGQFELDGWHWIIEHAGLFLPVLILSAALTGITAWLVLRARYQQTIAKLRFQLREFEHKLNGATANETRRKIDALQARLRELEPRRLTSKQQAVLKRLLTLPESAGITEINVTYDAASSDGKHYAHDFTRVLGSCRGWRPFNVAMFGHTHRPKGGLAIVCYGHGRTAAGAKLLSRAFREAGIEHETTHSTEEQLELVITSRLSAREGEN